ncbi:cupin domain-containing protein [Agromyces italicus]|uniref:cupin domain-containing protein n=1 Tax=Agromyces italicus TaxID=279572 RepID=UPI0003B42B6B|nr:cupin domain-containing protein [Agromyces italicus]
MTDDRPATARRLDLAAHPEGGWFRRTWTGRTPVDTDGGARPAATLIHYLLTPGEHSAWHVVSSDEVWLWHGPGALELSLGGTGERPVAPPAVARTVLLGPDPAAGHVAQCVVHAGTWQSARLAGHDEVLASCLVSPGFDFADWRLAD